MNKRCKDCGPDSKRPIFRAGRCATHDREFRRAQKQRNHDRRVQRVYGLGPGEYEKLYEFQGGHCAICGVATGARKALAVDHDHLTGTPRGLLCGPDNLMIGRLGPSALARAILYLADPPYRRMARDDA
jgi:hypothetical protein